MKTVSPYAFASILILSRIFAMSMYVPSGSENPTITAVCVIAVSALKALSLIPLFILVKKGGYEFSSRGLAKIRSAFIAVASAGFLLMITDAFSTVVEAVYPDRFTKIGVIAVFIAAAAYVASMGMNSLSRTASVAAVAFIIVLAVILLEMRSAMRPSRINLYSTDVGREVSRTVRNILAFTADYFIFFTLLPYLKSSPAKAAGLYITADMLITTVYLLMSASVMGSFWSKSGFSFFTLAYCTQGATIDRTDGIFLAVSTASAIVCAAALITVCKDSVKFIIPVKSETALISGAAILLTAVCLSANAFGIHIGERTQLHSAVTAAALFLGSAVRLFFPQKEAES